MSEKVFLSPEGPYFLRRKVARLLPDAARTVQRHMGEAMPPTTVRLAHPSEFGPAVLAAADASAGLWRTTLVNTLHRRAAREAQGMTVPTHDGGALVLLHIAAVRDPDQLHTVLVHELVHAVQMGRPSIAANALARTRHALGIEHRDRRWLADHDASVDRDEDEAYRIERLLSCG
ncbi:hypothetical protein [Kitasatospora griseola]|uniref:hypothetical protein n=1 Tax=Kitasatospora griseola TaxID=2064 RepID=UPI00166FCDC0|nr:hypothetical protein [Kitasatospora griseola]GGQ66205.1 hypothetical protein GCM10010195_22340 [Kitasatospora griseola]